MDYGKKDPSLGWRFTDAWLSMAGNGDRGIPNGMPVDEWGIKVDENSRPVGSCVARGGDTNGPGGGLFHPEISGLDEGLCTGRCPGHDLLRIRPGPGARCEVAQQMFRYTAFTADFVKEGLPVVNADGTPKWRFAPSPHGVYWKDGMKLGYQDAGSWTLMKSTPDDRAKAAWLYAQFVTSKTVDVKKSHMGLTFIRQSTLRPQVLHRSCAEARRPDRVLPFAGPSAVVADRHERS